MEVGSHKPTLCTVGETHSGLVPAARVLGWNLFEQQASSLDAADTDGSLNQGVAVVLTPQANVAELKRAYPHALILSEEAGPAADLQLSVDTTKEVLQGLLAHGEAHWRRNLKVLQLVREVGTRRQRMHQLSEIGLSLSTRMELDELLETILSEARRIAGCDAGSLYLVEEGEEFKNLSFKLAQNDSLDVPYVEKRLPLTTESLAGYVALSGEELNINDVYELPKKTPYSFNRSFDEQMGYRTQSMLVLPMRNYRQEVVGVLQFINRLHPFTKQPMPFDEEIAELLRAVASQAAVSIQKNTLIRDINQLFESFVQASVKTIEQRDPTTSGHSFRVADTTVALLEDLPRSQLARFRDLSHSVEHIREVRYAALLHDFGKVSVREDVLTKPKKLSEDRLEIIHYRVELEKERLRRRAVERELDFLHRGVVELQAARHQVHRELAKDLSQLDDYLEWVTRANEPNVIDEGGFEHLNTIREYGYREFDGTLSGLINDQELLALSVRRGSLTPDERREIQSHVVHTKEFLSVLPWPPELQRVPEIAGAHHEKLDGSGYPDGLEGEQIPLASRVMTVCDIYDALTAMDRPYKPAMSDPHAFEILEDEAGRGLLDTDIVEVFIKSRVEKADVSIRSVALGGS